jgi:acetate kinase
MKLLCVNAGSSSLKFQLFEMPEEKVIISGYFEKIGLEDSFWNIKVNGEKIKKSKFIKNHTEAVQILIDELIDNNAVKSLDEIKGVGHRVVHGGEKYKESVIITDEVINDVIDLTKFASLHHPGNLAGINALKSVLPKVPMVAVFDTAFHQTMPPKAYLYQIPYRYYTSYKIRKYGFHGTSHKFVANRVAQILNRKIETIKIINCHLGQGASVCAIDGGKSIDTSMGLTPLAGIPMATRSGDIDPAIIPYIMKRENLQPEDVEEILNKQSGAWGISGVSVDYRDIEDGFNMNDQRSIWALESQSYKIAQFIGQYIISLGGLDVLTFSGGVGENGKETRERICKYLEPFGIKLDPDANNVRGKEKCISCNDSKVKIFVIPTDEELMIARETYELVK